MRVSETSQNAAEGWIGLYRPCILKHQVVNRVSCHVLWKWRKWKGHAQIQEDQNLFWSTLLANIFWSWRRLQDVFSITILHLPKRLEEVLKTYWKHLARLISSRFLQDVLEDEKVLRWRRLLRRLEDMSWRRLKDMSWRCLEDIIETSKILTGDICI